MRILKENFETALDMAILAQQRRELQMYGPKFQSGLVAGWIAILEASRRGERITVNDY